MSWRAGLVSLLVAGCGGELPGDEPTGSAVARLTTVPPGVQCVRVTIRGTTLSFGAMSGASSMSLDLGVQAGGSVQVSASAYDFACAAVTAATNPSWVSDPVSATIMAGYTTSVALTLRPATRATASVDFLLPAVAIAAGGDSTYAVMQDGTVRAWGDNRNGELGDGTTTTRLTPVTVTGLPPSARRIVAGAGHACALTGAGVYCWGANDSGQLGDGSITTGRPTPARVDASGVEMAFTSLTAGDGHTCAATSGDGRFYCWGLNDHGQLGDGTTTNRRRPTIVPTPYWPVFDPAGGEGGTCALTNTGRAVCWGRNAFSRFGGDVADVDFTIPIIPSSRVWAGIAMGSFHMCLLEPGGAVYCAGNNPLGQVGDGTTVQRPSFVPVSDLRDATAIAVGRGHSCALRQDRTVWCWGADERIGVGRGGGNTTLPTQVQGLQNVTAIAAGNFYTCALLADGSVRCWGDNEYGQIGDGTVRTRYVPERVRL
ncbi:MAG: hypothetical protein U0324_32625 [Polyangiales bacterium]